MARSRDQAPGSSGQAKGVSKNGAVLFSSDIGFVIDPDVIAGCGHPDKQELMRLYRRYESKVVQRRYPELENLEGSVKSTTLFYLKSKTQFKFFDNYIASEPELTKESMESLIAARDAAKKAFEYYDSFVSKGQFELTEAEHAQGTKYMFDSIDHAGKLFSMLEGEIEE